MSRHLAKPPSLPSHLFPSSDDLLLLLCEAGQAHDQIRPKGGCNDASLRVHHSCHRRVPCLLPGIQPGGPGIVHRAPHPCVVCTVRLVLILVLVLLVRVSCREDNISTCTSRLRWSRTTPTLSSSTSPVRVQRACMRACADPFFCMRVPGGGLGLAGGGGPGTCSSWPACTRTRTSGLARLGIAACTPSPWPPSAPAPSRSPAALCRGCLDHRVQGVGRAAGAAAEPARHRGGLPRLQQLPVGRPHADAGGCQHR